MRSILFTVLGLLSATLGQPQEGDWRLGIDRPTTQKPLQINPSGFDYILCTLYGLCGNSNTTKSPPKEDNCYCVPHEQCNDTTNNEGTAVDLRFVPEKCTSSFLKCCRLEHITYIRVPKSDSDGPKKISCGNRNVHGFGLRIPVNVDESMYGEFPWMVAVLTENTKSGSRDYICGGSLITPNVVLTGAHSVLGKDNVLITAGEWDTQRADEPYPTQDRKVRKIITHDRYNYSARLVNDIALLILETPVDMKYPNVGLICLPEANEVMDDRQCVASGWGKNKFGDKGLYQVIMKSVELPMVRRDNCQELLQETHLGNDFRLHESFVCAGGEPGIDMCEGDGGSPLVCPSRNNPDVYVQAGIVAWGIGCKTETPGVYASVPYFVNWIENQLAAENININNS